MCYTPPSVDIRDRKGKRSMRHLLIYDNVLREAAAEGLITVESLMPKAERLALMFGDQEVYSEWVVF